MTAPKVSICIPNFNMGKYLQLAVKSALAQTYEPFEVVVCDNASTDDSLAILSSFEDSRLRVIRNETNMGMIRNFNKVVALASAAYIKLLEADDLLEPECLAEMMALAEAHPDIGIISASMKVIDAAGNPASLHLHAEEVVPGRILRSRIHTRGNEVGTPTHVLLKRSLLEKTGLFDLDYGSYLNDFDLWVRCFEHTAVCFTSKTLIRVRRHPEQVGAVGNKDNREIDVNHLMIRKRWATAKLFSPEFFQRLRLTLDLNEKWIWTGLRRLFVRQGPAPSRFDVFAKIFRNSGPAYGAVTVIYCAARAPLVVLKHVARHLSTSRRPTSTSLVAS